jgi:hypothetical protein
VLGASVSCWNEQHTREMTRRHAESYMLRFGTSAGYKARRTTFISLPSSGACCISDIKQFLALISMNLREKKFYRYITVKAQIFVKTGLSISVLAKPEKKQFLLPISWFYQSLLIKSHIPLEAGKVRIFNFKK